MYLSSKSADAVCAYRSSFAPLLYILIWLASKHCAFLYMGGDAKVDVSNALLKSLPSLSNGMKLGELCTGRGCGWRLLEVLTLRRKCTSAESRPWSPPLLHMS